METQKTGRCECGGVTFAIDGSMRGIVACHCAQCARTSGHFAAFSNAAVGDVTITDTGSLKWYRSSNFAERGFCGTCGSSLFWRLTDKPAHISIAAGALDRPTGLTIAEHIFVGSKSDYYTIDDGKPQKIED